MVYLDNAATTKVPYQIAEKISTVMMTNYGNPSSLHSVGERASEIMNSSIESIANNIGCNASEIIITSGGTESDNIALRSIVTKGDHLITTSFEHPAVMNTCKNLEECGVEVTYVTPNAFGIIDPQKIESAIKSNTKFCSVMHVNNELGTIQNIMAIANICHQNNVIFHTDAVQSVGHIEINVHELGVDMLSASAHKFNCMKGIGFLYVKNDIPIKKLMFGGSQQYEVRPGTENVAGIYGMAEALDFNIKNGYFDKSDLKKYLINAIENEFGTTWINGSKVYSLDKTLNFGIHGVSSQELVVLLSTMGFCVSAGSACHEHSNEPSHVLKSIGLSDDGARSSIRVSFGYDTKKEDVVAFVEALKVAVKQLRAE